VEEKEEMVVAAEERVVVALEREALDFEDNLEEVGKKIVVEDMGVEGDRMLCTLGW